MNTYLKLLLFFSAFSPALFFLSKIFVKTVEAVGKENGPKKNIGFMLTGVITAAIVAVPFFVGFFIATEDYHDHRERVVAVPIMYFIALVPSFLHIRSNIEMFYRVGYWRRLK